MKKPTTSDPALLRPRPQIPPYAQSVSDSAASVRSRLRGEVQAMLRTLSVVDSALLHVAPLMALAADTIDALRDELAAAIRALVEAGAPGLEFADDFDDQEEDTAPPAAPARKAAAAGKRCRHEWKTVVSAERGQHEVCKICGNPRSPQGRRKALPAEDQTQIPAAGPAPSSPAAAGEGEGASDA